METASQRGGHHLLLLLVVAWLGWLLHVHSMMLRFR